MPVCPEGAETIAAVATFETQILSMTVFSAINRWELSTPRSGEACAGEKHFADTLRG